MLNNKMIFPIIIGALAASAYSISEAADILTPFTNDTPDANSHDWGGWTRGDTETIYAQWDIFKDGDKNYGVDHPMTNHQPDVGQNGPGPFNLTDITQLGFTTSTDNLYSFTVPLVLKADIGGYGTEGYGATSVAL